MVSSLWFSIKDTYSHTHLRDNAEAKRSPNLPKTNLNATEICRKPSSHMKKTGGSGKPQVSNTSSKCHSTSKDILGDNTQDTMPTTPLNTNMSSSENTYSMDYREYQLQRSGSRLAKFIKAQNFPPKYEIDG